MQTKDALIRVAAECAEDLAADGVVYAEVRFAPELHLEGGLTPDEVVEAVLEGFRLGSAGTDPHRRHARSRPCATPPTPPRSPSWPCATATAAWSASTSPAARPATRPPATSTRSGSWPRENFHITIHAGEAFGLPSIWEAVQLCGAERLGHGVRIVDDIAVDDDGRATLGRLASFVRDRRVPLEMCPTSNVNTGVCDSIARAPDRPARRAAVPRHGQHRQPADERGAASRSEMAALVDAFGYGWDEIEWFTLNAMKSSFWPFDQRLRIINELIKPGFAAAAGRPPLSAV